MIFMWSEMYLFNFQIAKYIRHYAITSPRISWNSRHFYLYKEKYDLRKTYILNQHDYGFVCKSWFFPSKDESFFLVSYK